MTLKERCTEWWGDLRKIWKADELQGIERPVDVILFVLKTLTLTELIQLLGWNWKDKLTSFPDWYVFGVTVFLGILLRWSPSWSFWPRCLSVVIAIYFLGSVMVYLLNVVLLDHKVFGDPRSPERSLILFILNVAQVVLIFAILYSSWLPNLGSGEALVDAVLVFGTVSLQKGVEPKLAAIQVAIDVMLLAVFLAHFVGGVGRDPKESQSQRFNRWDSPMKARVTIEYDLDPGDTAPLAALRER